MNLPFDVARCNGVADADRNSALPMCRDCERYRWRAVIGPRTPFFDGPAAVIERYGSQSRLECVQRIRPEGHNSI